MFFMSFSSIVARRRGSQLATTVQVLTPPGKPSTWFPGEGLVTQARLFPSLLLLLFALVLRSCSLILLFHFVFVMILCYGPCSLILSDVLLFNVTFVFTSCFCWQICDLNTFRNYINLIYVILNAFWNFQNLTPNLLIFWNFACDRFLL